MSDLSEFITKHEKIFNKANMSIVESAFKKVKSIYIDLALLKDTRMGLMVSLSDKADLQYLIQHLREYNIRLNRKFTEVYPKFKVDENTLNKYYHDPAYSAKIFDYSPDTDFSINFEDLITMYSAENDRSGYTEKIDITINTYPLQITDNINTFIRILNKCYAGKATFNAICTDPKVITESAWTSYSVLCIDDIEYTLTNSIFYNVLFERQKIINTVVFAPYCCNDTILNKWKQYKINLTDVKTINDLLKVTEYALSTFCYFSFIPFQIPVPQE